MIKQVHIERADIYLGLITLRLIYMLQDEVSDAKLSVIRIPKKDET